MKQRIIHIDMRQQVKITITELPGSRRIYHPSTHSFVRMIQLCVNSPKIKIKHVGLLGYQMIAQVN